jgi:hypothetical protein
MGVSSDAILFYGICFNDETPECFEEDYNDWESDWENKYGPKQPEDKGDYKGPEWDKWREEKKEFEGNGIAMEVGIYCSYDYPMYFVAPQAHTYTVYRGDFEEITPEMIAAPRADQIAALKEFCELHNIPYSEPKWFMVSRMG